MKGQCEDVSSNAYSFIVRFCCIHTGGGDRHGERVRVALLLYPHCIPIVFPLDEEEGRGEATRNV